MEKLECQQEVIFEQKQTIADQGRQLRLLPDLQKQAEQRQQEVELKHVENEALKKLPLCRQPLPGCQYQPARRCGRTTNLARFSP